jgi:putative ABC transport system ATP-binding protein
LSRPGLREGQAEVRVAEAGGDKVVATLGVGDYFGERSLITGEVRNATVVGRNNGSVYALDKGSFDGALAATPSLQAQLRTTYFARH